MTTAPAKPDLEILISKLSEERLTYREIRDKLVRQGFESHEIVVTLRQFAKPKWNYGIKFLLGFVIVSSLIMLAIYSLPNIPNTPGQALRMLVCLPLSLVTVALSLVLALLIVTSDPIIIFFDNFNQILKKYFRNPKVEALDQVFLSDQIGQLEYEAKLAQVIGKRRAQRHSRLMRHQKHFGLD